MGAGKEKAVQVVKSWTILMNEKTRQTTIRQGETIGFEIQLNVLPPLSERLWSST